VRVEKELQQERGVFMDPIIVALVSPNDVARERNKVSDVIANINPLLDRALGIIIAPPRRWEDLPPEFDKDGAQVIIDRALRLEDSDLFVAIIGERFGTGTLEELTKACDVREAGKDKPEIMVYFRQAKGSQPRASGLPVTLPNGYSKLEAYLNKGLWGTYKNPDDLGRKLSLALIDHALRRCLHAPHRPEDISWFVKFFPREPGLADSAVLNDALKDLRKETEDGSLTQKHVAPESGLLKVEGTIKGYTTFKKNFKDSAIQKLGPLEVQDVWHLDLSPCYFVQPLGRADSHLLQVLVRRFVLSKEGRGIHILLEFDSTSPAIWRREARRAVREHLEPGQKRGVQQLIDDVVWGKIGSRAFTDRDVPFRHANGGVLPILHIGDRQYYCLFYRETAPIGWNIANGGSDDSDELIDPSQIILRELREELIMVGAPPSNKRYTFFPGDKGAHNRPEYLKALGLWKDMDNMKNWPSLDRVRKRDVEAEVAWEGNAPDSMTILAGDYGEPEPLRNVYVNVTAEDCAIEVDRVAILKTPAEFRLLDGEVYGGELVNRPIGLFEVGRFATMKDGGAAEDDAYKPNTVFYTGMRTDSPSDVFELLERHLDRQERVGLVTRKQREEWESARKKEEHLRLCPITKAIIRRRLQFIAT
jgi:hypothetical protein